MQRKPEHIMNLVGHLWFNLLCQTIDKTGNPYRQIGSHNVGQPAKVTGSREINSHLFHGFPFGSMPQVSSTASRRPPGKPILPDQGSSGWWARSMKSSSLSSSLCLIIRATAAGFRSSAGQGRETTESRRCAISSNSALSDIVTLYNASSLLCKIHGHALDIPYKHGILQHPANFSESERP